MEHWEFNELLRKRTFAFSIKVIAFLETVPQNPVTRNLISQYCSSATSVGANWIAFCRARSRRERYSKICIVNEEADESKYWTEIFEQMAYGDKTLLPEIHKEASEITAITTTIKDKLNPK